jgi:hypothetical protein
MPHPAAPARPRAVRFALACGAAAIFILWAPYVGQIRSAVRSAFPAHFVLIATIAVGGAALLGLGAALLRIRDRRAPRYAAIALAAATAVLYAYVIRTGNPEVDAVERVHFVQYGLVTWLFYRAWRPLDDGSVVILPALSGFIVGVIEEWFQWFVPVRIGEVRDVFLNVAAIGCGLLVSLGVDPPAPFGMELRRGSAARIGAVAATAIVAFAAFFHAVHLGHEISAEGIGVFRSRYDRAALEAHSRERAERWRTAPPIGLRRFSREDQYFSEGIWHVQRRNEAWAGGDAFTAYRENLILEAFYAPVLDAPSYVAAAGHRWPAEQREDADRRGAAGAQPYVSGAHRYPIVVWSKAAFWIGSLTVAGAVLLAARLSERRRLT